MRRAADIAGMVRDIERRVSIRKIWHCNAGWGMTFILTSAQARASGLSEQEVGRIAFSESEVRRQKATGDFRQRKATDYEMNGTVFAYYGSIPECVRAEYAVWVLGKNRPSRKRAS